MVDVRKAASRWADVDARDLLTQAAISVGAGSPTDAGTSWVADAQTAKPIVLGGGVPDPATLPVDELRNALEEVLRTAYQEALRYGGVAGFGGLREALATRQGRIEGMDFSPDNFVVNNGGAGSIDAICDAFLESGDVAILEGPTFSGSARTFRGHMAGVVQVPVDDDGVVVERVAEAIHNAEASGRRVKLFYTIPDFQNPSGTTLSRERREALLDLCAVHRVLVVEDSAYSELHFRNVVPPSLYSLANGQGVLKVGSFSKIIATGLRVGWIQGREDFIEAISRVKFDMGTSPLLLRAIALYIASGQLDQHVERVRPVYAEKCEVLSRSLEENCSPYVRFARPRGGFFLWVECIGPAAQDVINEAAAEGLIFPAGSMFFLNRTNDDTSHIRLAFSTASLNELEQVGPRLRSAFERALGER